jgi:hypothetical protein
MQMEDGFYADNRRNSHAEDKLRVGALAEMQTNLSWYNNVVTAVYEKRPTDPTQEGTIVS